MVGAESITLGQVLGWVRDLGSLAILTMIVWGAVKEWWVTGLQYRRIVAERDEYKQELLSVLGLTDRAVRAVDKAVKQGITRSNDDAARVSAERSVRRARSTGEGSDR